MLTRFWVYPLPLALILILIGTVLLWRGRRWIGVVAVGLAVAVLYLLSTPAISNVLVAGLEDRIGPVSMEELPAADAIVVLGGGVLPAAKPRAGPDLGSAFDRVWQGADLFRAGKAPRVIVTGARPYEDAGPSAALAASDLLVRLGVPRSAIVVRDDATSTREDALAVQAVTHVRDDIDTLLLVTSAMHMPRALATFQAIGLQAWPVPTDRQHVDPAFRGVWSWLPHHSAFASSNRAWHEYVGVLYYRVRGWI